MAHQLSSKAAGDAGMAAALRNDPAVRQARIDLAACLRMAARLGMAEGICNHFSATLPGHPGLFLVNPLGLAFCEVTASRLLVCHVDGRVVDGDGEPELCLNVAEVDALVAQAGAAPRLFSSCDVCRCRAPEGDEDASHLGPYGTKARKGGNE